MATCINSCQLWSSNLRSDFFFDSGSPSGLSSVRDAALPAAAASSFTMKMTGTRTVHASIRATAASRGLSGHPAGSLPGTRMVYSTPATSHPKSTVSSWFTPGSTTMPRFREAAIAAAARAARATGVGAAPRLDERDGASGDRCSLRAGPWLRSRACLDTVTLLNT
eukprot:2928396-Pleurochrysis_carterae.AAC.3